MLPFGKEFTYILYISWCPAEFKSGGLINATEGISRQCAEAVAWLLLTASTQVYSKNEE